MLITVQYPHCVMILRHNTIHNTQINNHIALHTIIRYTGKLVG